MSSLFPDFTNLFNVGKTISQNSNTDPNDVLNTKNALAQTGDYQVPDYGITDIPDIDVPHFGGPTAMLVSGGQCRPDVATEA